MLSYQFVSVTNPLCFGYGPNYTVLKMIMTTMMWLIPCCVNAVCFTNSNFACLALLNSSSSYLRIFESFGNQEIAMMTEKKNNRVRFRLNKMMIKDYRFTTDGKLHSFHLFWMNQMWPCLFSYRSILWIPFFLTSHHYPNNQHFFDGTFWLMSGTNTRYWNTRDTKDICNIC